MTFVDWAIVLVIAGCMVGGLVQGFLRTACSLAGLIAGLVLAAWNYRRLADFLLPWIRVEAVADAITFFVTAVVVMAVAAFMGGVLARFLKWIGLGCLDRMAGAVLGFFQGVVLVTLTILVTVAFFPRAQWLTESRLPREFFDALHLSTQMTPAELAERVRDGLRLLERESPPWMHPGQGLS
jgi:membrane protein required for colicin V production